MKKRLFCLLMIALIGLTLVTPAMAFVEYGVVYDESEALGSDALTKLGTETLPQATQNYGVDLRVDIFDSLDNPDGIRASAAYVYENYGYGYGDTHEGVSLTIVVQPDENGWTVENWCVYAAGADETAAAWRENCITAAVSPYMEAEQWAGDLVQDQKAVVFAVQAVVQGLEASFAEPVAAEKGSFIFDDAGLLTPEQAMQLESMARQIADAHNCGVYVLTVDDFRSYGLGDVYETAYGLYHENNLGIGPERNGVTLLLSMAERDYATFFYGDLAEYAFDEYGQEKMEEEFLDDLAENDWYGGFSDLMAVCDEYLTLAEAGEPVRFNAGAAYGAGFFLALPLALIITLIIRKKSLKSVAKAKEASQYASGGGLHLVESWDHFTHTTVTTRTLKKESSGGSSGGSSVSRSGGGGSGRSGKF